MMKTVRIPLQLTTGFDERRLAHFAGLEEMNARFYRRFAGSFHQTRGYGWPGWRALLDDLPNRPLSVYDIACGNGRLTELLEHVWCTEHQGKVAGYVGIDRDLSLLAHAQERQRPFSCQWGTFNWSAPEQECGSDHYRSLMVQGGADWITLFGVMHHVYSASARVNLVSWAAQFLKPQGRLSISLWDFGAQRRYRNKTLLWADHMQDGLAHDLVEEGDFLLGWKGEVDTPRYCHWMNREEESYWLETIAQRSPELSSARLHLHPRDGNRYWTWHRM